MGAFIKKQSLLAAFKLLLLLPVGVELNAEATSSSKESQINNVDFFFLKVPALKAEKWQEIVVLGEEAIRQCIQNQDLRTEFLIIDQLVSTYFRLGAYEKAKEKGERLIFIGEKLKDTELIITSLYKHSAVIRGLARVAREEGKQRKLFNEARELTQKALEYWFLHSSKNLFLKAKLLYNTGAIECDDPQGNISHGVACYNKALEIFTTLKEEDCRVRTLIRLGKANYLQGNIRKSRKIVDELRQLKLEVRTGMQLDYLEAQVLKKEKNNAEAKNVIQKAIKTASELKAEADLARFQSFLLSFS